MAPWLLAGPLILLLLEDCIIPGFSTCVPQLQGDITGEDEAGADNLSVFVRLSVWLAACLSESLSVYTSGLSALQYLITVFVCLLT